MDRPKRHAALMAVCAAFLAGVLAIGFFALGRLSGQEAAQTAQELPLAAGTDRAAWDDMDPAQLSWVAEGIQERISELQDDLHYVCHLQMQKMNGG